MTDFITGDVVELKSGGPKMTVHRIVGMGDNEILTTVFKGADRGDIECKWFDNGRIESAFFKEAMLKKVEDNTAL